LVVFLGLFHQPFPAGKPACCNVLRLSSGMPGKAVFPDVPFGKYYLFAAAFAESNVSCEDNAISTYQPELIGAGQNPLVCRSDSRVMETGLRLRSRRLTDPPLLFVLPELYVRRGGDLHP